MGSSFAYLEDYIRCRSPGDYNWSSSLETDFNATDRELDFAALAAILASMNSAEPGAWRTVANYADFQSEPGLGREPGALLSRPQNPFTLIQSVWWSRCTDAFGWVRIWLAPGQFAVTARAVVVLVVVFAFGLGRAADRNELAKPGSPAYPVKVSANRRYLLDQNNVPFLIAGESPQALMVNLSEKQAELFFANRAGHGFNTVWINLLCKPYTGGRPDGSTYDGILPFKTPDDLSTPNPTYFDRCDHLLRLAARHGLLVMLDPIETGDFLKVMVRNGPTKCREFGRYLGRRYGSFDNLLWLHGNDYQNWRDPANDAAATAVALGIKDEDKRHFHTIELNYEISGSLDDPNWAPIIDVCASYTYYPVYAQVLKDYNRPAFLPVLLIESDYEFERESIPVTLRRQEYWSILSGATGQLYGNRFTWPFLAGWQTNLDTPGAIQMAYVKNLFETHAWFDLVPDQAHRVVTAGYGTFDATPTEGNHYNMTSDYVTAGRTPDGSLVMAYMPTFRPITVDLAQLSGAAVARWYDPSSGRYTEIAGSPFANTGKHLFIPPRHNAEGDDDWILVLQAQR